MNVYRDRLNARRQRFADRLAVAAFLAVTVWCLWLLPAAIEHALVMR